MRIKFTVNPDQSSDKKQVHPKTHNNQNTTCRSILYFGEKIKSFVFIASTFKILFTQVKAFVWFPKPQTDELQIFTTKSCNSRTTQVVRMNCCISYYGGFGLLNFNSLKPSFTFNHDFEGNYLIPLNLFISS